MNTRIKLRQNMPIHPFTYTNRRKPMPMLTRLLIAGAFGTAAWLVWEML